MNNWAWPAAFAFAAACAAIAWGSVNQPEPKNAQITCIEQRGKWIPGGWRGHMDGTCDFSQTKGSP